MQREPHEAEGPAMKKQKIASSPAPESMATSPAAEIAGTPPKGWAIITGAGSGIGAALAHRLIRGGVNVLAVGRRESALRTTVSSVAPGGSASASCVPLVLDIASKDAAQAIRDALPRDGKLLYLVHNAAIGDPGQAPHIDVDHFRYALEVNVVAPLALTQGLLPLLQVHDTGDGAIAGGGRVLHLGTGVAQTVQRGTGTYGVTKLAFFRLYQQLHTDLEGTGVVIGSARPGVVETEGMRAHVVKADAMNLPHADYFKDLFAGKGAGLQDIGVVADFLFFLLTLCPASDFGSREWTVRDQTEWWGGSDKALLPTPKL